VLKMRQNKSENKLGRAVTALQLEIFGRHKIIYLIVSLVVGGIYYRDNLALSVSL